MRSSVLGRATVGKAEPAVNTVGKQENFFTTENLMRIAKQEGHFGISRSNRPTNIDFRNMSQYNFADSLHRAGWFYHNVSIFPTIVLRIVKETFRHGLDWEARFALKCEQCGGEYDEHVEECECGSKLLRPPMESQKDYFKRPLIERDSPSFDDEANDNGKSLLELCKAFLEQSLVYNNPYVLAVCDYITDDNGEWTDRIVREFVQIDPLKTKRLFNESGSPGDGHGFLLEDRSTVYDMNESGGYINGKRLYPAHYKVSFSYGDSDGAEYYMRDEIYSATIFGESLNYGYPPCLYAYDALMTYHFIEKRNAREIEQGHPRGVLALHGVDSDTAQDIRNGMKDLMDDDPYSIPVISTTPQMGREGRLIDYVPLSETNFSERLGLKNEIRDRICALLGVPNLFVSDVSQSGGLNNESQQISIFDRYLDDLRLAVETMLDWAMSFFPLITDFRKIVSMGDPTDPESQMTVGQKRMENVQYAMMMQQLGFEIINYKDGEFEFSSMPKAVDPFGGMFGDMGGGMDMGMDAGTGVDTGGGFDDSYMGSSSRPALRGAHIAKARNWRKEVNDEAWDKFRR